MSEMNMEDIDALCREVVENGIQVLAEGLVADKTTPQADEAEALAIALALTTARFQKLLQDRFRDGRVRNNVRAVVDYFIQKLQDGEKIILDKDEKTSIIVAKSSDQPQHPIK